MFGITRNLRIAAGLLFGGLVCLALGAPAGARAAAPRQNDSPEALVQKLEKAVKAADEKAVAAVLAETPENLGREELIAYIHMYHAAGVLEYILEERFGMGQMLEMKSLANVRIEIVNETVICGVVCLQLRVSSKNEDGSTTAHELWSQVELDGNGLILPDGFSGSNAEESRILTDLSQYMANLFEKTAQDVNEGKFESRDEVLKCLAEDLQQAEPMQRFMTKVVGPKLAKVVAEAFDKAFKKTLIEAAYKEKIIGSWQDPDCPDCPMWSFTKDGQVSLVGIEDVFSGHGGSSYRYELDGNKLTLIPTDDQAAVKVFTIAQLTDTVLVLVDSHGDRFELRK